MCFDLQRTGTSAKQIIFFLAVKNLASKREEQDLSARHIRRNVLAKACLARLKILKGNPALIIIEKKNQEHE